MSEREDRMPEYAPPGPVVLARRLPKTERPIQGVRCTPKHPIPGPRKVAGFSIAVPEDDRVSGQLYDVITWECHGLASDEERAEHGFNPFSRRGRKVVIW